MSYGQALQKAWTDAYSLSEKKTLSVKLLSDTYAIDIADKTVMSASCNVPAKEYVSIIALHYLIQKLKTGGLPAPTGEWVDFNQLEGGEGYYPAFKKRTIDQIVRKYGRDPEGILKITDRMPAKKHDLGDASVIVYPFEDVPILITMWKADDEFGPSANILFDKTISKIFCTEDVVVLTEFVVHQL